MLGKKVLNLTVNCSAVYNGYIEVPEEYSLEQAIKYAKDNIDEIKIIDELDYVEGGDIVDEDNCYFE